MTTRQTGGHDYLGQWSGKATFGKSDGGLDIPFGGEASRSAPRREKKRNGGLEGTAARGFAEGAGDPGSGNERGQ